MRRIISILFIVTSFSLAQTVKDVRIVSEDDRSLTLEYAPKFSTQKLKTSEGKELQRIAFTGEIVDQPSPGLPWISYKGVPLQFPDKRALVSVVSLEFRTLESVRPLAIPSIIRDPSLGYSPKLESEFRGRIPKHAIAEIVDLAKSAGKFIGTLRFYPIEYSEESASAKLYTKIVVRIDFDAWSSPAMKASAPIQGIVLQTGLTRVQGLRKKTTGNSPLSQGAWYKMEVGETGIYKIDQSFLQKANISTSAIGNINSVRIFGSSGEMLPEDLSQPRPNGLEEVARYVVDNNGNGAFDADDYILFYGRSTRGWKYDASSKSYNHSFSYYSEPNYYFLTYGGTAGISMDTLVSLDRPADFPQTDFQEKIFVKQERYNLLKSGRQWVGPLFKDINNTLVYSNLLSGLVTSKPVQYRFVFLSQSATYDTFTVFENGALIGSPVIMSAIDLSQISDFGNFANESPVITFAGPGTIPGSRSNVKIVFGTDNSAANGWIDYMDLLYRRSFVAVGDALLFDSPDMTSTIKYEIHGLPTSNVFVFDVTNHNAVKRITQFETDIADGSIRRFDVAQTAGNLRQFAVVGLSGTKSPGSLARVPNSNLHGFTPGAEFVIISPAEFADQAQRLATYRQSHDSLLSTVALIENIYNEFSSGLLDPMAVRDFLAYAVANWTVKPKYALLFGNGHYDYKNITSAVPNRIPPYESLESLNSINSFTSDDFLVMLDEGSPRISISVGRIPARSLAEATSVVSKIIAYESSAPFDTWRNRITFVADDGMTSLGPEYPLDMHTAQAEDLALHHTPNSFEKDKIYLSMYPTVNGATGRRKPQVNVAIDRAINQGTLITNFCGHGNELQWTHEAVFTRDQDIPQLVNRDKLTFVVAATCNFAQYDDPSEQSAGELILVMDQGGAIAGLTSSRVVYQDLNQELNNQFYDFLFPRDAQGNPRRLGDVMWLTKQVLYQTNDLKYHLFGDPTMRLNVPRSAVSLDSVNGKSTTQIVTMKSLGTVSVNGTMRNPDGSPQSGFNGRGVLEVFDSQQQIVLADIGDYQVDVLGSVLYRGEVSITNGFYRAVLPIPKDVSYGSSSRLSFYAQNGVTDGIGYTENVTINGTDSTAVADTTGPKIVIYFDDPSFRAGDRVKPNTTLIVDLNSRNGINTSTVGIGHRLEATLNKTTSIDLTNYYRGDLDTYQSGQVRYQMSDLADGNYSIAVKAWDIRNNSSQEETSFQVSSSGNLEMVNVVNYPNPFSRSTTFTFQRNSQDPIDVEVKIYTVAGRLIENLQAYAITDRFVRIPWNGRDHDGDQLANGVYLYKVIAKTVDKQSTKEEFGKMTIMR